MAFNRALADRVRAALPATVPVREVRMFGGLSFMVNEKLVIGVMHNGDLLVRADPGRVDELFDVRGAKPAMMGNGRTMGRTWIAVDDAALATREDLDFWIGAALDYAGR